MKRRFAARKIVICTLGLFLVGVRLSAAQAPPSAELSADAKEKLEWLQKFVGSWETRMETPTVPEQPAMNGTGSIQCPALGDLWIVSDLQSQMGGTNMQGLQTVGFDTATNKYVGTWVDSMFNYMWRYEGWLDDSGKTLTLEADGPNFMDAGKTTKFRDIYEFESNDKIRLYSKMLTTDGEWVTFMSGIATRTR